MRRDATEAEKRLWARLRRRQVAGRRFRRQHPVGTFVVDFCCLEEMLIVEVDGGQHSREETEVRDQRRTAWLERVGYRVLRFWNDQVLTETEAVIETIAAAMVPSGA